MHNLTVEFQVKKPFNKRSKSQCPVVYLNVFLKCPPSCLWFEAYKALRRRAYLICMSIEREREREKERERDTRVREWCKILHHLYRLTPGTNSRLLHQTDGYLHGFKRVCVCVCVCDCLYERESVCVCVCV